MPVTLYPAIEHGGRPLRVEHSTDPGIVLPLVPEIIRVTGQAYAAQHEEAEQRVPHGTFEHHYDPNDPGFGTYIATRALMFVLGGGVYHLVRNTDNAEKLDATAHTIVDDMGDCDIKEIMAYPPRKGLGSAMLYAALRPCLDDPDCYNGEGSAKLEAIRGSSVNTWYESIGFESSDIPKGSMTVGEYSLPLVDYAVPEHIGVRGVLERLENKHPELRSAVYLADS
jgi:hypothetical protein